MCMCLSLQAGIEHYNRTKDDENYLYYIEKLNKLNLQIGEIIERENRKMTRIQGEKQKKRNSRRLENDPLTGKPLKPLDQDSLKADGQNRPQTAAVEKQRRNSRFLSQAPQLSVIERNKMKNNFKMALASKKQEEEKTGKTTKDMEKQLLADT